MSDFIPLRIHCRNCGAALSARYHVRSGGVLLQGLLPLDYIHTESQSKHCPPLERQAAPHDGWSASAEYERDAGGARS